MKINYQMIGNRIRYHRMRRSMTQEELADGSGISRSYMGYLERGEKIPSLETLVCLASTLHISLEELLEGQMYTSDETHTDIFQDCTKVETEILLSVISGMKTVLHRFSISE